MEETKHSKTILTFKTFFLIRLISFLKLFCWFWFFLLKEKLISYEREKKKKERIKKFLLFDVIYF